jgi:E4 protein
MEWMTAWRRELSYQILGPTTLHLQHEFYLWISLILLSISSFQSLYKGDENSFGSFQGDYLFVALVALWLSRFLILRWIVTWDPSDSLRPTLWGVVSHWITSHVLAGQYFDRPSPEVIAKQMGTQHYHGNFEIRQTGGTRAAIRDLLWPSLIYTWRYIKSMILYPFLELYEQYFPTPKRKPPRQPVSPPKTNQSASSTLSSSQKKQKRRNSGSANPLSSVATTRTASYYTAHISRIWKTYGPSLQMIIPIATFVFYIYVGFFTDEEDEPPNALTMQTHSTATGSTVAVDLTTGIGANVKPYGAYKQRPIPSWSQILFYISFGGTMYSILAYGRIVLPIPDLVAGCNVLKAMRNEAKHYQQQQQQQQQTSGSGGNVSESLPVEASG